MKIKIRDKQLHASLKEARQFWMDTGRYLANKSQVKVVVELLHRHKVGDYVHYITHIIQFTPQRVKNKGGD